MITRFSVSKLSSPARYRSLVAGYVVPSSYELISTTVLSSSAATVTFTGLDTSAASYKHLQVRASMLTTAAPGEMRVYKNSLTSGYWSHFLEGYSTTIASIYAGSQSGFYFWYDGGQLTSSRPLSAVLDIPDFSNTSKNQTMRGLVGSATGAIRLISSSVADTSAITSLTFTCAGSAQYAAGTRISLYGLRG